MKLKRVKIGDLGTVVTGNTPPRKDPDYYGSAYPFIKPTDIELNTRFTLSPEECYSEKAYKKYKNSLIPKGSTCVVTIGSIGKKITMAHADCFINQAMNAVVPNNRFDKLYVFYLLKQNLYKVKALDSGTSSGRENVSKSAFSSIEVDVNLDKETQKKIGLVLNAYDNLIENNLRRTQLLEEAARAQFMRITKDVKETKSLSNFASIVKRGISPKYVEKEGIMVLNQKCIRTLSIDFSQSRLTDQSKKISPERMLQKFDTVVNSTGMGTLGRVSLHLHEDFPSTVDSHVTIVRAREEVPRLFLAMAILIQQDVISMMGEGATNQTELSAKRLSEELTIPVISTTHMLEYHNVIIKQMDLIWNLQKQIVLLKQARDIILPRLMSGEIDVSSISIPETLITEPLEAV